MAFDGMRVLALESRRSTEIAALIRKQGGEPFVAPSMREVPLESNTEVLSFADRLLAGAFDCMILLTGVGTRLLWKTLLTRCQENELRNALSNLTLVVRGPKPSAALREIGLTPNVLVPEPNTWREVLAAMSGRAESRIAIQEYGKPNPELIHGLEQMGRHVTSVPVYGWELPEDIGPLREAAARLASGQIDVALFTTSMQIVNLIQIATEEGIEQQVKEALATIFVASIGPTTSETLTEYNIRIDFEPSHAKMGLLVNETAARLAIRAEG